MLGVGVHLVEVAGELVVGALSVDDILVDTAEQSPLDVPEEHAALVPLSFGLGADELLRGLGDIGQRARGGALGRTSIGTVRVLGLLRVGIADNLDIVALSSLTGVELLLGEAPLVVILDADVDIGRRGRDFAAAEQKKTQRDVVPAELPVVLDHNAVHPGGQGNTDEKSKGSTDTDNGTGNLRVGERDRVSAALPEQQHGEQAGGQAKVDGHDAQSPDGGVAAHHDGVLGDQEEDGRKGTRKARGDDPGQEDLHHTGVDVALGADPLDTCEEPVSGSSSRS